MRLNAPIASIDLFLSQMIKILITEVSDSGISAILEKGKPAIGKKYLLEDATSGTLAQNRLFHLLIEEWIRSGCCSWDTGVRDHVKRKYGEGFEAYLFWDGAQLKKVSTLEQIPKESRVSTRCFGKLKSWSDYTLKQRRLCIDKLIQVMIESGVNSDRFNEIIEDYTDR